MVHRLHLPLNLNKESEPSLLPKCAQVKRRKREIERMKKSLFLREKSGGRSQDCERGLGNLDQPKQQIIPSLLTL